MNNKFLVTGGFGFIGSALVRELRARNPLAKIVILDKLNYAADLRNISIDKNMLFLNGDINNVAFYSRELADVDVVYHLAANSHVDFSITSPTIFVVDNVLGTQNLLEACRSNCTQLKHFIHVSTDEVYGDLPLNSTESFTEESELKPSSPYSASKLSSDLMALSYYRTFGFPVIVTRCSNNFGPRQDKSKLIPKIIKCLKEDLEIPLYNGGLNKRDWLSVDDHVDALITLASRSSMLHGDVYNIGTGVATTNIMIIQMLADIYGKAALIKEVDDRPGHDQMYRVDSSKIRNFGWEPNLNLHDLLNRTVSWYECNSWRLN